MSKQKPKSVPNKHIYARVSYLYQAATYLATNKKIAITNNDWQETYSANSSEGVQGGNATKSDNASTHTGDPRIAMGSQKYLVSHLRAVSLKGQVRLSREMKRSLCKRCDAYMVPASTYLSSLENQSRQSKKRCADVQVLACVSCGATKRFPIGASRQKSKNDRKDIEVKSLSGVGLSDQDSGEPPNG